MIRELRYGIVLVAIIIVGSCVLMISELIQAGIVLVCCFLAACFLVLANHGELMETFGKIGHAIVGPTGIFPTTGWIWQHTHKTLPPNPEPTGLFLIDERCPGCLGTGRLRVNILEDDLDEERMWRELKLQATLKDPWQVARTCTGCGMPFITHKNVLCDWCSVDCQTAYYERGKRTLGVPVDLASSTLIGNVPIPSRLE